MLDRRRFFGAVALPAVSAAVVLRPDRAVAAARDLAAVAGSPAELARDEDLWREAQQAFTVGLSITEDGGPA